MGVPGLWEVLQEAGHSRSLTHYAVVDGFECNESGRRAKRIGIDASLWYFHAENSTDAGSNPELRLLFFRLCKLYRMPLIPLFIFDGRMRPKIKRGNKYGKSGSHWLTPKFKEMLECFGMEWRVATGEAEAELAYLNRIGVIDAVVTDDVDAFVFGARTVIRNMSLKLTGNKNNPAKNSEGKDSEYHVRIFEADAIETHRNIQLTRGGMILFALISGGDYDNGRGVRNFGPSVAYGLARCGFGDRLLSAYFDTPARFQAYLPEWRAEVSQEIRTNSKGFLPGRRDVSLPAAFPDIDIFETYANPICSGRGAQHTGLAMRDKGNLNLARIAEFCEAHFDEWGHKSAILKRFRNVLWEGAVMHVLRRAALEADEKERSKRLIQRTGTLTIIGPLQPTSSEAVGTPALLVKKYLDSVTEDRGASAFVNRAAPAAFPMEVADTDPLIVGITTTRTSVHTDHILEYRVAVNPIQLVRLVTAGIHGKHPEAATQVSQEVPDEPASSQKTKKKPPETSESQCLMWIPASIMRQVHPELVETYNAGKTKAPRTQTKGKRRAMPEDLTDVDDEEANEPMSSQARAAPTPAASQPRPSTRQVPILAASTRGPSKPRVTSAEPSSSASQPIQPLTTSRQTVAAISVRSPAPPTRPFSPLFPRIFYNVGLIETEEPMNDGAFLFTFTNPDDPDYVLPDGDEHYNEEVEVVDTPDDPPRMPVSASQPLPLHNLPPTRLASPVRMALSQPQAPTARSARPAQPQAPACPSPPIQAAPSRRDHTVRDWDEWETGPANPSLSRYDTMFDQILGIVPGANRRKQKATKRTRALGITDVGEPSDSHQPKKRKTAGTAGPLASLPTPAIPTPSSQHITPLQDLPPPYVPSQASSSRPQRTQVHREVDFVILDSDDENPPPPKPARRDVAPSRWNDSQNTASSQQSMLDSDRFFAGIDHFARLS